MSARSKPDHPKRACDICPFAQQVEPITTVLLDGSVVEVGSRVCWLILPNGNKAEIKRTFAVILTFLAGGEVFSREEILIAAGSWGQPRTAEVQVCYLNKLLREIRPELRIKNVYSFGWRLEYRPK
jgi:hypothetical protein